MIPKSVFFDKTITFKMANKILRYLAELLRDINFVEPLFGLMTSSKMADELSQNLWYLEC